MASRSTLRVSRLTQIQQMLEDDDAVTIGQLTDRLGVSEATVRRDLDALQRSGYVQRTHGGAVATQVRELPYPARGSRRRCWRSARSREPLPPSSSRETPSSSAVDRRRCTWPSSSSTPTSPS